MTTGNLLILKEHFLRYDWAMKTTEASKKNLVLIDSNAIIHRAYHALPKTMTLPNGTLTNAVYGFTTTLIKVVEDLKPDYIAATFDLAGPTFRHTEYKEYKATRVKADQELYDQIPMIRDLLKAFEIPVYEEAGFEADDVIGTIADLNQKSKIKNQINGKSSISEMLNVYIVTGDKDAFQLIDGNTFVYNLKHGLSNAVIVNRETIETEWQLQPEDFIDLKALAGDPSDNIPGVPGIGPKTATDLLQRFGTLVKLYEKIETAVLADTELEIVAKKLEMKPRILNLLLENKEQAFLSQRLATIRRDVPLNFNLEACGWGDYSKDNVRDFFESMHFQSLLRRFGALDREEPKTAKGKEQRERDDQLSLL